MYRKSTISFPSYEEKHTEIDIFFCNNKQIKLEREKKPTSLNLKIT